MRSPGLAASEEPETAATRPHAYAPRVHVTRGGNCPHRAGDRQTPGVRLHCRRAPRRKELRRRKGPVRDQRLGSGGVSRRPDFRLRLHDSLVIQESNSSQAIRSREVAVVTATDVFTTTDTIRRTRAIGTSRTISRAREWHSPARNHQRTRTLRALRSGGRDSGCAGCSDYAG